MRRVAQEIRKLRKGGFLMQVGKHEWTIFHAVYFVAASSKSAHRIANLHPQRCPQSSVESSSVKYSTYSSDICWQYKHAYWSKLLVPVPPISQQFHLYQSEPTGQLVWCPRAGQIRMWRQRHRCWPSWDYRNALGFVIDTASPSSESSAYSDSSSKTHSIILIYKQKNN